MQYIHITVSEQSTIANQDSTVQHKDITLTYGLQIPTEELSQAKRYHFPVAAYFPPCIAQPINLEYKITRATK